MVTTQRRSTTYAQNTWEGGTLERSSPRLSSWAYQEFTAVVTHFFFRFEFERKTRYSYDRILIKVHLYTTVYYLYVYRFRVQIFRE